MPILHRKSDQSDQSDGPYTSMRSGMLFRDFISQIVRKKQARSYLEIGVRGGETLAQIECSAIGVDPNFAFTCSPIGTKQELHLYQMTSDAFFREHDPVKIFKKTIDVAFLDGLHLFEYLLRDFMNVEKHCACKSLIILDDCIPANVEMTERYHKPEARRDQNLAGWWTGDVWKVVRILREYRSDLRLIPVDTTPTGNVCVTNLDPDSNVLSDKYFEIVDKYRTIELNDASFREYIKELSPINTNKILNEFDMSLFI